MSAPLDETPRIARWRSAQSLAMASWMCPVLIIFINFALQPVLGDAGSRAQASMLFAVTAFTLAVIGLGSGIAALSGIRRHGSRGILFPALIGSALSGMYVAVFIVAYLGSAGGRGPAA